MQKYDNKKNTDKNFKKNDNYVKPIKITVPVYAFGTTPKGDYDTDTLFATLETLQSNKTFDMLTVPVSCSRAILENNSTLRGFKTVGKILSYDASKKCVDILVYSNFVHLGDNRDILYIDVKVRTKKNSTEVASIDSFNLRLE